MPPQAVQAIVEQGIEAGQDLALNERETRRLIDAQLRATGWEADIEAINHKAGTRPQDSGDLKVRVVRRKYALLGAAVRTPAHPDQPTPFDRDIWGRYECIQGLEASICKEILQVSTQRFS